MKRWMRHGADFSAFEGITAEDTVVDVGCGAGDACVAAGRLGAEVIGVDVDPALIPHLQRRMREVPARSFRALASDCDPIPLPDGVASFVICTEVMEHVDDPARFASELNRIGKPGATYIVSVPDPASEWLMESIADPSYFERPNHQRVYSHADLDGLLGDAGLDVIDRPRSPNNFYWAMWCLLRWSGSVDGLPDPGSLPPIVDRWDEVWDGLLDSPGGERVARRLDRMIPRSQAVIARKSGRTLDLARLDATWRHLVKLEGDPRPLPEHRPLESTLPDDPAVDPGLGGRWRRFVKNGKVKFGRVDVAWSIRRARTPARKRPVDA